MKKVIIIGAGPAGLTAGYELLSKAQNEYDVTILEADKQIGGISKTICYNGNRMDIGGHRFFSKDETIMNFWKDLMPLQGSPSFDDEKLGREKPLENGGPNPNDTDEVMLVRDRVSRIYTFDKFFDYPISLKFSTFKNMGLKRTFKAGCSYLKSTVCKKEEDTLENFYINRFGKQLYSMFFEKYTEKVWGRSPSQISSDWGNQRVKGLSVKEILKDSFKKLIGKKDENVETSLIEQFWYPKYGPGQLWETLATKVENLGGKILKEYDVQKINITENNITSVECTHNGKSIKFDGDIFISSMPVKDLINDMQINKPDEIDEIANGLPYRDFMTVGLLVKKLNLKNKTKIKTLGNIIPDCWIYVQDPSVKFGRIQIFNNWSPYLTKNPEENVWLGLEYFCNEGDEYWNMTDDEFKSFAIAELVQLGIIEKEDVIDSHREKIKKAYPAYFDTYKDMDKLVDYLNNYENLYCIGRNGQHRYNNMDHSMLTAIEATNNIISGKKEKDNIWNVNTEKEYHEKK